MNYAILIRKQAKKKLQSLPANIRVRIAEKIEQLGINPDSALLDVKKLQGQPFYRLRAGDWRVLFDRQDKLKIISIEKVKSRGEVYK